MMNSLLEEQRERAEEGDNGERDIEGRGRKGKEVHRDGKGRTERKNRVKEGQGRGAQGTSGHGRGGLDTAAYKSQKGRQLPGL